MIPFEYSRLSTADLETHRFAFTYPPEPTDDLTDSIRTAGILTPLLIQQEGDTLHVLDGRRRLRSAESLGWSRVPVAILPRISSEKLLDLWIASQQATRSLNPFETAALVKNGPGAFRLSGEETIRRLAKTRRRLASSLLASLPDILSLPEKLKREAVRRAYGASFLIKITRIYPAELLKETARILDFFSLSENQMDQLLTWLDEIAKRDRCTPREIITADSLSFILRHPKMPTAKKRDAILKAVYKMRFPQKAVLDAAIRETRQKIESTGPFRLLPPKDLAGDRFELKVAFRNTEELMAALRRVEAFQKEIDTLTKLI